MLRSKKRAVKNFRARSDSGFGDSLEDFLEMAVSGNNSAGCENRNSSDSDPAAVPIRTGESELFAVRLREIVGEESQRSFAGRCGFSDRLLGSYMHGEKLPGVGNLRAIADAGGVTVDWLVSGRPPKWRSEVVAALRQAAAPGPALSCRDPDASASYAAPKINAEALAAILAGILDAMGPSADLRLAAQKAVDLYFEVSGRGLITPDGSGQPADCA